MPASRVSTGRIVVELVAGSAAVLSGLAVTGLGVVRWLLTFLEAAYPCGETYLDHPSCRLADPGAVETAYRLMIGVPAVCTLAGLVVGILTFVRWRHAIAPPLLALAAGIAAHVTGSSMLSAALHDVVPW